MANDLKTWRRVSAIYGTAVVKGLWEMSGNTPPPPGSGGLPAWDRRHHEWRNRTGGRGRGWVVSWTWHDAGHWRNLPSHSLVMFLVFIKSHFHDGRKSKSSLNRQAPYSLISLGGWHAWSSCDWCWSAWCSLSRASERNRWGYKGYISSVSRC